MASQANGTKRKRNGGYDIVPTFSDSDDIPDLDGEADDGEDSAPTSKERNSNLQANNKLAGQLNGQKETKVAKHKTKKRKKSKEEAPQNEEDDQPLSWVDQGEDDGAFDPGFSFEDPGVAGDIEDGFGTWDVPVAAGIKRVGVDDIIRRRKERERVEKEKQALKGKQREADLDDEDQSDMDDGIEDNILEGEDEVLAEDAFGMGAEESDEESDAADFEEADKLGSDEESADEAEEPNLNGQSLSDEDDDDSVAAPVPHPDDLEISDREDEREDPTEAAKRDAFFAKEEPSKHALSKTESSFQSMQLSRPILKGLTTVGFTDPTPIQAKTVPIALLGKDVVGGAVTGSGKTAAFVLPILERLLYRPKKVPTTRVTILTPTRELAVQCHNVATKLAQFTDITFALIVGGLSLREQEGTLKKRPDVVIATPGRFIDHMRNTASFAVDAIEILVLDEADRMLEDGFADELNELLKTIPRSRQTMLFSATMTSGVDDLVRAGLSKPVRIVVDAQKTTVPLLVQEFVKLKAPKHAGSEEAEYRRLAYLVHICTHVYTARTIVFIPTKALAHRVKVLFALRGIAASELHGSMSQEQRLGAIADFRDGKATHLLATDLASRGLDIPRVETVINYTVPTTSTTYLHRVGRTARAGRGGVSVTIFEGTKVKAKKEGKAASERTLLRPILKIAKSQGAPMRTRNLPLDSINTLTRTIADMQDEIDEILKEEKQERLLQQTERDVTKGQNLMEHEDEIKSRPRRTWFQSEKDKKTAKEKGANERLGLVDGGDAANFPKKGKRKLSGKEKKTLEARDERKEGKIGKKRSKVLPAAAGKKKGKPAKVKPTKPRKR